jgi:hypothetical protein
MEVSVRPLRTVLHVTLFVVMVLASAGPVLAASHSGSSVAEPRDVATANEGGHADNPCFEVPPPPPARPDDGAGTDAEVPPPPPDYPPGWLEDSMNAAMDAFVAERIAAIEAAGGADPAEVPPPPPARPDDGAGTDAEVPPPCAYRMAGGAGKLVVDAVVCDLTRPFTVTGSRITLDFTPNGGEPLSGGTYTYSGDFGKFSLAGQGTYTLTLSAEGGSILAKGRGVAKTPRGTFSASGKERYSLTPASC